MAAAISPAHQPCIGLRSDRGRAARRWREAPCDLSGNEDRVLGNLGQAHQLTKGSARQRTADQQRFNGLAAAVEGAGSLVAVNAQPRRAKVKSPACSRPERKACDFRIPPWAGPVVTTIASTSSRATSLCHETADRHATNRLRQPLRTQATRRRSVTGPKLWPHPEVSPPAARS